MSILSDGILVMLLAAVINRTPTRLNLANVNSIITATSDYINSQRISSYWLGIYKHHDNTSLSISFILHLVTLHEYKLQYILVIKEKFTYEEANMGTFVLLKCHWELFRY